MKIKQMEHWDEFYPEECICWLEVEDVLTKFCKAAKRIDGNNYSESCFGICVGKDEGGWYVCQDKPGCELYYVDNNGNKNWMSYMLTDIERTEVIEFCKNYYLGGN